VSDAFAHARNGLTPIAGSCILGERLKMPMCRREAVRGWARDSQDGAMAAPHRRSAIVAGQIRRQTCLWRTRSAECKQRPVQRAWPGCLGNGRSNHRCTQGLCTRGREYNRERLAMIMTFWLCILSPSKNLVIKRLRQTQNYLKQSKRRLAI